MLAWQTGRADKAYLLTETIRPPFGMSQVTLTHAHCRSTQPNLYMRVNLFNPTWPVEVGPKPNPF